MQKKHTLLLGAHISTAGGFDKAVLRAQSIGCTTMQIFTKSNRQWRSKPLTQQAINDFQYALKNSFIKTVVTHAAYLINLGSTQPDTQKKSIDALKEELSRCDQLSIAYLVLHPGTSSKQDIQESLATIAHHINKVLHEIPGSTTLLIETMAGQGNITCYTFEQIATIINAVTDKKRIGVCLDTCHVFAAGYDLTTPASYKTLWENFDAIIGRKYLKVIHVNDSKKELGSRIDRHEEIGKGALGLEAFRLLFNDETLFDIPKILETPKEDLMEDFKNMKTIEHLLSEKSRELLEIKIVSDFEGTMDVEIKEEE